MLTLIDNFDSFTNNLVHAFVTLGVQVEVMRYDQMAARQGNFLVIGPGPGSPANVPKCLELIRSCPMPILGICLGHQCIASCFGGVVRKANYPMHGKKSQIFHKGKGLFSSLPNPLEAGRYHSLVVERETLPSCLEITATTAAGEIMALKHRFLPIYGLQFHPESILTPLGQNLLKNFLNVEEIREKSSFMPAHTCV